MSGCIGCGYDWKDLPKHKASDDCQINCDLRIRFKLNPSIRLVVATEYEDLIEDAGLEMWRVVGDNYNLYAFVWAVRICQNIWLGNNRTWILRYVARNPPIQNILNKRRKSAPLLYKILLEHIAK